jgi:hypothetical protein
LRSPPGGALAVAIITLILGAFGGLASLWGLLLLIFAAQVQNAMAPPGGGPAAEMQAEIQSVSAPWRPVQFVLLPVKLVIEVAMLVGAIALLMKRPMGRKILCGALIAAGIIDLAGLAVTIPIQWQTSEAVNRHLSNAMHNAPGGQPGPPPESIGSVMKTVMIVSIVIGALWVVGKVAFYGFGTYYLSKPQVRAYYDQKLPSAEIA